MENREVRPRFDPGRHRGYLKLLAQARVPAQLRPKFDSSDVVQRALLEAHRNEGQFRGETEAEYRAWLRAILTNELTRSVREFRGTDKRDPDLERSLQAALEQSSARLESWLVDPEGSPALAVERSERLERLAEAMAQLPEPQRRVIELHHVEGYQFTAIASELGRTLASVMGLHRRGLERLRALMNPDEGANDERQSPGRADG
jgi:RNA polymerase sigma-70 factor (ECF subfamily)